MTTAALLVVPLLLPTAFQEDAPGPAAVTREQVEAKLRFLAADGLGGRGTGTAGSLEAARWMARLLAQAGVRPAGDLDEDGAPSYLQDIGKGGAVGPAPAMSADGEPLALGRDLDLTDLLPGAAELVVRVVRAVDDLPDEVDPDVALYLDVRPSGRRELLEAAGTPDGVGWGAVLRKGSRRSGETEASLALSGGVTGLVTQGRVHGDWAERFASGEVKRLSIDARGVEVTPAYNVVGILEGVGTPERPGLADEVLVLTAHYDHLGTRPAREGDEPGVDRIFNGADDDASGTVAVLEIAEALAAAEPPARTVLVVLVTGEERGLLGTNYLIANPVRPIAATVCNLNFEMIGRPDDLVGGAGKLWLTGFERSNLGPALQGAGLPVQPDERPQERFFYRSDNIAFARLGIVAQTLSSYDLHDDYHRPTDEADTLDFEHMTAAIEAGLGAARLLATGALDPAWVPGGDPSAPRDSDR